MRPDQAGVLLPGSASGGSPIGVPFECSGPLFNETTAHSQNGEREEDETKDQQIGQTPEQVGSCQAQAKKPGQLYQVGEGEEHRQPLGPERQILKRKEGPAENKHGGNKQEDGQVVHFDRPDQAGENHGNRSKGDAAQKRQGDNQEPFRIVDQTEETDYSLHDRRGKYCLGRAPYDFGGNDFFQGERSSHHCVKGFLKIHPDKRCIGVFKESVLHDVDRQQPRGDKCHIGDLRALIMDGPHQHAQSHAKSYQVEDGFKDGRDENDLPDLPIHGQVSLPDPDEPPGDTDGGRTAHSLNPLPVSFRKTSSSVAMRKIQPSSQYSLLILLNILSLSTP